MQAEARVYVRTEFVRICMYVCVCACALGCECAYVEACSSRTCVWTNERQAGRKAGMKVQPMQNLSSSMGRLATNTRAPCLPGPEICIRGGQPIHQPERLCMARQPSLPGAHGFWIQQLATMFCHMRLQWCAMSSVSGKVHGGCSITCAFSGVA